MNNMEKIRQKVQAAGKKHGAIIQVIGGWKA